MGALWRPYRLSLVSRKSLVPRKSPVSRKSLVLRRSLVSRSDDKIFAVVLGRRQKHHLVGEWIADAPFEPKPTEAPEHGGHIHALSAFGHIAQTPQVVDVDSLYKDADENVVFQLINTEQNRSFLEQVPHREFQDLSIIYKLVVNADAESIQSIKVTNSLAERLGMNEEQLFKYAAENTRRILPPRIRNMNDVMKEMFLSDGMPEEIAEMMIREVPPEQTLWIISNNRGIDGAVSMLYENELHELAENLESDLYILPSSVHEVLAVSTELTDPEELAQMVAEVNMQKVALEERLSNQVYHYDKDLRKLTLATDTPNKSLDGIVAEPQLVYDAKEKAR